MTTYKKLNLLKIIMHFYLIKLKNLIYPYDIRILIIFLQFIDVLYLHFQYNLKFLIINKCS